MKAGTTWLYKQLKGHPEIYFTPIKELHYFANKAGIGNQLNHQSRLNRKLLVEQKGPPTSTLEWYSLYSDAEFIDNDWYIKLFSSRPDRAICSDFSNLYCLMESDGWSNVREVAESVKVIYTLRDPFERVWSHYKFHQKFIGNESKTLDASLEEFKKLLDKNHFWRNAQYAENYIRLKSNLHDNELMLLYMEDTVTKPLESLEAIQRFLGVEVDLPSKDSLNKKFNATKKLDIPEDWNEVMIDKLRPEVEKMKKVGIWHDSWTNI